MALAARGDRQQDPYHAKELGAAELEGVRRQLAANLALITDASPARTPILAHMRAIDAEIDRRSRESRQMPLSTIHEAKTIDQLAELHRHAQALISSGILDGHQRTHMLELCDRIDAAVARQRQGQRA